MKLKRVLSMALCLCMVLSMVPATAVFAETQTAAAPESSYSLTIEAEDTTYAVWNMFTTEDTSSADYSGGKGVGGVKDGVGAVYASFDAADTTDDLAGGFVDKSGNPYVAFHVNAAAAGTYYLSTGSYLRCTTATENLYAAFVVNPSRAIEEPGTTVAYKGYYNNPDNLYSKVYLQTNAVAVQLEAGVNVIYVFPLTAEQNIQWTNVDYLKVEGNSPVTAVAANMQTLYAGDAPYVYGYATLNAGGSIGGGSWGTESLMDLTGGQSVSKTRPISEMNAQNARTLRGFTYTVNAPENGYYDLTVSFNSMTSGDDSKAIGFLVDGTAQAREFTFNQTANEKGVNRNKGYINLSVYLSKGNHVLTVTAPANRTSAETANNSDWCDYAELLLYGGLTQAVVQSNPCMDWWYAEAEYQTEGYSLWHTYTTAQSNKYCYRDYNNANYAQCNVGNYMGYGNSSKNYTLTQLQEGRLDKTTASGITVYVEAPADGTYTFKARNRLDNPGIWDSTNSAWLEDPVSVFMVNGDFGAAATFTGQSTWVSDTTEVSLSLKKGLNEITYIPQTLDTYKSGSDWVNVDCIFVDTALQVVTVPTGSETVNPGQGVSYLYTAYTSEDTLENATVLKNSVFTQANNENLSASAITYEDLYKTCFVAYTVEAPYDGYYNISVVHTSSANNTAADHAFAVLVDDGPAEVKHILSNSGTADISTYMTAGTHVLTLTAIMPIDGETNDMYWTNMGTVTFGGGLTLAQTQINPLTRGMTVLEAEEYANYAFEKTNEKKYKTVGELWYASGGKTVGGADASTMTTDQVKEHLATDGQPFVEYIVEAAEAGFYELRLGVRPSFPSGVDSVIYMQINGQLQEVPFTGKGDYYACFSLPVTVSLQKGRNVIRVLSPTLTQTSSSWIDQDYLAIPEGLVGHKETTRNLVQADRTAYMGNFNYKTGDSRGWDSDMLDNSVVASFPLSELSLSNFLNTSWYSVTVTAPADGYYPIQAKYWIPKADETVLVNTGLLANGKAYPMYAWQDTTHEAYTEAIVYLNEGDNDLIFTGLLSDCNVTPDSNNIQWLDADFIRLCGGLTLAQTQRYPLEGLITGSAYTLTGNEVSNVPAGTTAAQLKSNFEGAELVTVQDAEGNALADTAAVTDGTKVVYSGGSVYTVTTYCKGDVTGDGLIDIRDLKAANEYVLGNTETVCAAADIVGSDGVNADDVAEYQAIIMGKTDSDALYLAGSIGAAQILELCNPVGRLVEYRGAVFMESSASGFTITGDIKGDVKLALRAEEGTSDGGVALIYAEVDGVVYEYPFTVNTDQVITVASGLSAGSHTIKITKGTEAKYDSIYVYSVSYNGTLTKAEAAAHTIEFLGDSITVGYGLYDPDAPTNGNTMSGSYYSYANVAADLLGADHYTIGNGGWRFGSQTNSSDGNKNNYLGYIYEKNSMNVDIGAYDFAWQPEVVVINLGTNDAIQYTPAGNETDQEIFNTDIAALLTLVRAKNPNATIFWVYGAMTGAENLAEYGDMADMIQTAIDTYEAANGDTVHYVSVTADTTGCYDHPTRAGQQVIGQEVAEAISAVMGWEN